jgi:LmbE family N-acetylglucosaminyl deacetylase
MQDMSPWVAGTKTDLLVIGAHPDDIEIGCGGSILRWVQEQRIARVTWIVLSGAGEREVEARRSAGAFLSGVADVTVRVEGFQDGYFPYDGRAIKDVFEEVKASTAPDLILTHDRNDRHQDHRLVGELTWQSFRDHLILEFEIPKFDGELGEPNMYVELPDWAQAQKVRLLRDMFPSQVERHWFSDETFAGLARLRGVECRSPTGYAEAFRGRKIMVS